MAGLADLIGTPDQIATFKRTTPLNTADAVMGNPSSATQTMTPSANATSPFANVMSSDLSGQIAPSYPTDNYNPMQDPEGPLARAGWIGSLLFGNGQSKTDHTLALKAQQDRQVGIQRAQAFKQLSTMMQSGMPPQQAFLQFMQTPEGANFIATDPAPQDALKTFITAGADPSGPYGSIRRRVFGGDMNLAIVKPDANSMYEATSVNTDTKGVDGVDPDSKIPMRTVAGYQVPAYLTPQHFVEGANRLAAAGDLEGAKIAQSLAEEMRLSEAANKPAATDELKEYGQYKADTLVKNPTATLQNGKLMSWQDYKTDLLRKGGPVESPDSAAAKARKLAVVSLDTKTAEKASEAAYEAQRILPALEAAAKASDVPGGYQGQMLPTLGRLSELLGVPLPEHAGEAEMLNAISMQLIPIVRQPGQVSNYEQASYIQAVPSLVQTRVGRKLILDMTRDMTERTIKLASIYRDALAAGEDPYKKGVREIQAKPLISEDQLKIMNMRAEEMKHPEAYPAAAPKIGTVDQGMEFQGGDPSKEYNWVKIGN